MHSLPRPGSRFVDGHVEGLRFVPADPTMAIVQYPMNLARA